MGLSNNIEKLEKYQRRLEIGKAEKIKPGHVEKVIAKLRAKEVALIDEIASAHKDSKRERLEKKLATVREQIAQGEWLLSEIGSSNGTTTPVQP